jgi:hypothetical protein
MVLSLLVLELAGAKENLLAGWHRRRKGEHREGARLT